MGMPSGSHGSRCLAFLEWLSRPVGRRRADAENATSARASTPWPAWIPSGAMSACDIAARYFLDSALASRFVASTGGSRLSRPTPSVSLGALSDALAFEGAGPTVSPRPTARPKFGRPFPIPTLAPATVAADLRFCAWLAAAGRNSVPVPVVSERQPFDRSDPEPR